MLEKGVYMNLFEIGSRWQPCFKNKELIDEYVLAEVGHKEVVLISVNDGVVWVDPIKVKDTYNITPDEWILISRSIPFKLVA